jgi:hypothetical protein
MRKIDEFERRTSQGDVRRATVYYHADWSDYFVRFYINGRHMRKMFYPADSREDAIARAEWFVLMLD